MAILMYHHIGERPPEQNNHSGLWVTPGLFADQLKWFTIRGYGCLSLDEVHSYLKQGIRLPRRWFCITFDDGWHDNFSNALPALRDANFTATVFVVSGWIRNEDIAPQWDSVLSSAEIQQMAKHGIIFGSHTRTHPRLGKLVDEETKAELEQSKEALSALIGADVHWLAYPYGSFTPRVAAIARNVGYIGALSTIRDNRVRFDQLFWLPRLMVMPDATPDRLGYLMSTTYHLVHKWKNRGRWPQFA